MRRFLKVTLALSILVGTSVASAANDPSAAAVKHYNKGLDHKNNGEMADALRELQAAIAECPTYTDAYWVLGWVQGASQDKDGACKSFNTFLGLAPDDPRSQQAKDAIVRLGGTVSPTKPDKTTEEGPQEGVGEQEDTEAEGQVQEPPATEEKPEEAQPALTLEQAAVLLDEADQALKSKDYDKAIEKCDRAAQVLTDDFRLHRILSFSYGGKKEWQQAFKHADKALALKDDMDLRFYRIVAALAPVNAVLAEGYADEVEMNALAVSRELSAQDSLAWTDRKMRQVTGGDPNKQTAYLIGRALYELRLYFYYGEQNPMMMQLGHSNLVLATEDANCPTDLLPDNNPWMHELVTLDFLSPQSDIEREAYDNETNWADKILARQADYRQVAQWRKQASQRYQADLAQYVEFATGMALASHDIAWRYNGPNAEQVAATQLRTASQVMDNTVREFRFNASERARKLAEFLRAVAPATTQTASGQGGYSYTTGDGATTHVGDAARQFLSPEDERRLQREADALWGPAGSATELLQPQTAIELHGYQVEFHCLQGYLNDLISTEGWDAAIKQAIGKYRNNPKAQSECVVGQALADVKFAQFYQTRGFLGTALKALRIAIEYDPENQRARQLYQLISQM